MIIIIVINHLDPDLDNQLSRSVLVVSILKGSVADEK